jgi:hypothetical protein
MKKQRKYIARGIILGYLLFMNYAILVKILKWDVAQAGFVTGLVLLSFLYLKASDDQDSEPE